MSSQSVVFNNGQQAHVTTETSQIFLWNRRSVKVALLNNSSYNAVQYREGQVMGRISATGKVIPLRSWATDGSQNPCGILIGTTLIDAGEEAEVFLCDDGDISSSRLIFQGPDTLNTPVGGIQLRDQLKRLGVKVIDSVEMTGYDNA